MCSAALLLACLVSSGIGRRAQASLETLKDDADTQLLREQSLSNARDAARVAVDPASALIALLQAFKATAAFSSFAYVTNARLHQKGMHPPLVDSRRVPVLAVSPGAERCVSWACEKLGSLACLEMQEEAVPKVGDEECQVSVRAIGLNYADIFSVLGLYEAANQMLKETGGGTFVAGFEFAGEIVRTGKGVSELKVGDHVYGFCRFGAFRTMVVARQEYIKKLPDSWTFAEGAALLAQGLTAWHGLVELGNAKKGSRVLVHSAAGGVGCAAMQICETMGCEAVGIVGAESKVTFLQERYPNCKALLRSPERQYAKQLDELGLDYDVVLDSLGGKYLTAALDRVAPMGRLVHFGATNAFGGSAVDGLRKWLKLVPNYLARPFIDPGKLVGTNRAVLGFNLIWLTQQVDMLTKELDVMLTTGGLASRPPAVGKSFPFTKLPEALDYLRSGASVGKVIVNVDEADGQLR